MANHYRGEVTVSVAGRAYTLRPTFHILCELEERTGLSVPALLRRVGEKGLLASEILMILAIATRHDGSAAFDSAAALDMPAEAVDLHALMPAMAQFLSHGLAVAEEGEADYATLLEVAYTVLRLPPQAFWCLTPPEFRVLLRAARRGKGASPLPETADMARLMAQFPDEPTHTQQEAVYGR